MVMSKWVKHMSFTLPLSGWEAAVSSVTYKPREQSVNCDAESTQASGDTLKDSVAS